MIPFHEDYGKYIKKKKKKSSEKLSKQGKGLWSSFWDCFPRKEKKSGHFILFSSTEFFFFFLKRYVYKNYYSWKSGCKWNEY